ncbi:MAG: hypothetical protein HEP71_19410 [Roseivirga sp.]|nr:hypothetical protein [Roseivirga sp.]
MKKFIIILLLALFTAGISSCASEGFDTDPVIPEVQVDDQAGETEEEEEEGIEPQ